MEQKMEDDEEIWERENERFSLKINIINYMLIIINCLQKTVGRE